MEHVYVAITGYRFQQYENGTDRYQHAGQRRFAVDHTDDRGSCDDHYPVDFHLHHRSETADQRNVLGSRKRLKVLTL